LVGNSCLGKKKNVAYTLAVVDIGNPGNSCWLERMMSDTQDMMKVIQEMEQMAMLKAKSRANTEKWNRDVTVFSFAILVIIVILLFQGIGLGIVAPVAVIGLGAIWLMGWKQGRRIVMRFYSEELSKLEQESEKVTKETEEEAIEEKVRKAMRDMWR